VKSSRLTNEDDTLNRLRATNITLRAHKKFLNQYVTLARKDGYTWKQIGDALDISRQAAQQRYGRHKG
jgi:hypothetical protein